MTERRHPTLSDFPPRVRAIIVEETARRGVGVGDVLSYSHRPAAARTRAAIWARERKELTLANGFPISFTILGRQWGRHHTTILSGVMRHEAGA